MTSTNQTVDYVEAMMGATLASLAIAARGIREERDVADDENDLVTQGEGIDANEYLRDLVLEERTPKHCRCTDFVFTTGGPRIWLRHYGHDDDWFVLYGDSAGLDERIKWQIYPETMPEVYAACRLLMDYDFMDLHLDPPPEFDAASLGGVR